MEKERICYFCKHIENDGVICPAYKCGRTGDKKESFDTCQEWKDYEDEV